MQYSIIPAGNWPLYILHSWDDFAATPCGESDVIWGFSAGGGGTAPLSPLLWRPEIKESESKAQLQSQRLPVVWAGQSVMARVQDTVACYLGERGTALCPWLALGRAPSSNCYKYRSLPVKLFLQKLLWSPPCFPHCQWGEIKKKKKRSGWVTEMLMWQDDRPLLNIWFVPAKTVVVFLLYGEGKWVSDKLIYVSWSHG